MGRGITCDIVGEPLRYFKRKIPTTHGPSPHTPPQTQRGRDRFPGHGLVTLTQRRSQQHRHRSGGHVHVVLDRGAASLEVEDHVDMTA